MIRYNTLSLPLPQFDSTKLSAWIEQVTACHNRIVGEINYIFCNDSEILDINRRYLQHDYYTDIITFDYGRHDIISGDLYISLDTVRSNAQLFNKSYEEELKRVIIHGVLHLVGIDDKAPGAREIMEAAEDAALALQT